MWLLLRAFVSPRDEAVAREHALGADSGHQHHAVGTALPWRERLTSVQAWSDVAHNFRGDWQMLWKEILSGFLLAGFIALLGDDWRRLRLDRSGPQVSAQPLRYAHLRRAHRPRQAASRDRPGLRHDPRQGHRPAPRVRRAHALLLLRALPRRVRSRRSACARRT